MGYRRNKVRVKQWSDWLALHKSKLIELGVPDVLFDDEFRWLHLTEHGFDVETGWSVKLLDEKQQNGLANFLRDEYGEDVLRCCFPICSTQ